ncbi:hypothetical protein ACQ86I_12585 [Prescottella equi]
MTRTGPREDIAEMGLHNGPPVDLVREGATADGTAEERRVHDFRVVEYRTPAATPPPTTRRPIPSPHSTTWR